MRSNGRQAGARFRAARAAALLTWTVVAVSFAIAPAAADSDTRYLRGYDFIPNPPLSSRPTTFVLYGVYPTGCGIVDEKSVVDQDHVTIRVRSFATCPDSAAGTWAETFPLGVLAAGNHTLTITLTMDRPDSGVSVHESTLEYGVEDTTVTPPPPPPLPPPLVTTWNIVPSPATASMPVALDVYG